MITVFLLILFVLTNSSDKLENSKDLHENRGENLPIAQRLVQQNQLNVSKLQEIFRHVFPSVGLKDKTAFCKSYVFQRIALYLDVDDYIALCQLNLAVGLTMRDYAEAHGIPENMMRLFAEKNEKGFGLVKKIFRKNQPDLRKGLEAYSARAIAIENTKQKNEVRYAPYINIFYFLMAGFILPWVLFIWFPVFCLTNNNKFSKFIFLAFTLYLIINFVFIRLVSSFFGLWFFLLMLYVEYSIGREFHRRNRALLEQMSVLIRFPGFARGLNADFLLNFLPNRDLSFMSEMPASTTSNLHLIYTFCIRSERFFLDAIAFQNNMLILTYRSMENPFPSGVKAFYRITRIEKGPEFTLIEVRIGNHFNNLAYSSRFWRHQIFIDFNDIPGFQESFSVQATITKK